MQSASGNRDEIKYLFSPQLERYFQFMSFISLILLRHSTFFVRFSFSICFPTFLTKRRICCFDMYEVRRTTDMHDNFNNGGIFEPSWDQNFETLVSTQCYGEYIWTKTISYLIVHTFLPEETHSPHLADVQYVLHFPRFKFTSNLHNIFYMWCGADLKLSVHLITVWKESSTGERSFPPHMWSWYFRSCFVRAARS